MSEKSGGPGPPDTFNLYNTLHRGEMPTVTDSQKKSYKALKHSYFTHPSDSEKYFVLSGATVKEMDVFDVQESLEKISAQDFKTYTRLNSGDVLVQTATIQQIEALKNLKTFGPDNKPVDVSENGVLNQSHAIIRCSQIMKVEIDKICKKLASQGVVSVQRLKRKVDNQWVDTSTHLLTFNSPVCPAEIRVGYLWCKTEIYIPSPFRCVVCQKLGHTKKRCDSKKNVPTCGFCAEPSHAEGPCPNQSQPRCVNCKASHPSFSKVCPRYIEEKEINAIRVTMRIPYNLAREEFRKRKGSTTPQSSTPFAQPSSSQTTLAQIIKSQEDNQHIIRVSKDSDTEIPMSPALSSEMEQ
ncbi:uncharacterized protein LOC129792331 [Lutzomyia longipalpis]|uniref:uncharacterized protein LOC129792331 n=1 Tax=Lutzomyia longipalpis TaxID=7200 RepID=UPI00248403FA|nr:uncharacterized protein LOC129792331 [Lutzomyia longipalpis]